MNTIYKLNFPNGKSYIGQTSQSLNIRLSKHKEASTRDKFPLYNAINKYGWDSVKVEILYQGTHMVNIDHAEKYFIREYNTLVPNGYNIEAGGHKNKKLTQEHKNKISKSLLGNKHCVGRTPWNKGKKLNFNGDISNGKYSEY